MTQNPSYEPLNCPLCTEKVKGHCNRCGDKIPNFKDPEDAKRIGIDILKYQEMAGNGFQSITAAHNHVRVLENRTGLMPVVDELCLECYRKDFAKAYPDATCPV